MDNSIIQEGLFDHSWSGLSCLEAWKSFPESNVVLIQILQGQVYYLWTQQPLYTWPKSVSDITPFVFFHYCTFLTKFWQYWTSSLWYSDSIGYLCQCLYQWEAPQLSFHNILSEYYLGSHILSISTHSSSHFSRRWPWLIGTETDRCIFKRFILRFFAKLPGKPLDSVSWSGVQGVPAASQAFHRLFPETFIFLPDSCRV